MSRQQYKILLFAIATLCSQSAEAHLDPWMELYRKGKRAVGTSDYPRAHQLFQQALDCTPKTMEYNVDRLIINNAVISTLIASHNFSAAERVALENVELAKNTTGQVSPDVYSTYSLLATLYSKRDRPGDRELSALYFRKTYALAKKLFGIKSEKIIMIVRMLQMAEARAGHHAESTRLANETLNRLKELPPLRRRTFLQMPISAGGTIRSTDESALDFNLELIQFLKSEEGSTVSEHTREVDSNISICLQEAKLTPKTEAAARDVLTRQLPKDTTPRCARIMYNLADFYASNRHFNEGEKLYERAISIATLHPNEAEYAMAQLHYAWFVLTPRKDYKRANQYYQRSISWFEEHKKYLVLGQALCDWASSLKAESKMKESLDACKRALTAYQRARAAKMYSDPLLAEIQYLERELHATSGKMN